MLIGKFHDGQMRELTVDIKNPNLEDLSGLVEVYKTNKTFKVKLSLKAEPTERKPRRPRNPDAAKPGRKRKEPVSA